MKTTSRLALCIPTLTLAAIAAVGARPACAADTPAAATAAPIPVAHSALLTINATPTQDGLALHILHAGNQIPIDGRDVTVSIDGKDQPVTAEPEGTFLFSTKDLDSNGERQIDITVAHDGIREILTGKIALPKASAASSLWSDHKQMAWWVLNIVIVLIAATAFSRKKPKKQEVEAADEEKD
jgi:hypothetical protein